MILFECVGGCESLVLPAHLLVKIFDVELPRHEDTSKSAEVLLLGPGSPCRILYYVFIIRYTEILVFAADLCCVLVARYEEGASRVLALKVDLGAQVSIHKPHLVHVVNTQHQALHLPGDHLLVPVKLEKISEAHVPIG